MIHWFRGNVMTEDSYSLAGGILSRIIITVPVRHPHKKPEQADHSELAAMRSQFHRWQIWLNSWEVCFLSQLDHLFAISIGTLEGESIRPDSTASGHQ